MQYEEFIEKVRDRTQSTPATAAIATASTLTTLGERVSGGETEDLASQLPKELKGQLSGQPQENAGSFSIDEFFQRVARREGVSNQQAQEHAKAVIRVISEAVTGGELKDVQSQLPVEFAPLFG